MKKLNIDRIMILNKPNGIFVIFCDFPYEDDFSSFLDFLKEKLGVTAGQIEEAVYLIIAELRLDNKIFEAIFDDQVGCMIRLEPDWNGFADEIVKKCTIEEI